MFIERLEKWLNLGSEGAILADFDVLVPCFGTSRY